MNETKQRVAFSEYLLSRGINRKLYDRLREKLEDSISELAEECPELKVTISMSAKYQKPYIKVETGTEDGYVEVDGYKKDVFGAVEHAAMDILDEVGFTYEDSDEKDEAYYINFED